MARLPAQGKPASRRRTTRKAPDKSAATAVVEGVAAVMATLAEETKKADRRQVGEAQAETGAPPVEVPPPPPTPPRPPSGRPPAGGGYSRTAKTMQAVSGVAPLAVAALAMLIPDRTDSGPVPRQLPVSAAAVSAGGIAPPAAMAADGDLPPSPPSQVTPDCLKQFAVDLPQHRGLDVGRRQTVICRTGYILSFNVDTRSPDWVMERLAPSELVGTASRGNRFLHDPALPEGADADNPDYLKTGFDRGHQAPAADAKFDQKVMDESFYFTNMSPQRGIGMNRGAWKFLEEATRSWVMCGGHPDLYVITGPIYGTLEGNPRSIGTPPVAVPRAYYKIVYDANLGRGVGFVLPNTKIGSRIDLQKFVVPIADIETETGLNFFRTMDQRTQAQLKDDPGVAWAHTGTCPGDTGE
jgi:endonuclease G, mitochondrial